MKTNDNLYKSLIEIFGSDCLHGQSDSAKLFAQDHNRFYQSNPFAVVFVREILQLQHLIRLAIEQNIPLVPSGGRTGLSGGATAIRGEVVVSFKYMNRILDFNNTDRLLECEAGVITDQIQLFAREKDLFYPVDFFFFFSSQIGGNIATNAGGIKVIGHGLTRDRVAGLTVLTGTGDLLEMNHGLIKNATGYDLRHLFIGSEGTLGFILKAQIRLIESCKNLQVMLFAVNTVQNLMKVLDLYRSALTVTAFEFFGDNALQIVLNQLCLRSPLDLKSPYYALLEFDAHNNEDISKALQLFENSSENGWVEDGVLAQSEGQAHNIWKLRESISDALSRFTPYKNDLSVRPSLIPDFIEKTEQLMTKLYSNFEVVWYGHIGDGNMHLNILKPVSMDVELFKKQCDKVSDEIYTLVQSFKGSISAEHGVGIQKRDYLHYSRSDTEIGLMRGVKAVFDPYNIMNPSKLLPVRGSNLH